MRPYTHTFLTLVVTFISTSMVTPCLAETPVLSNKDSVSISSASISTLKSQPSSSSKNKQVIISENASNTSGSKETVAPTKPDSRLPISSRIFAAPSMQQ
ncbi:MAG: hypothetical protein KME33_24280 [Aetokthonos hydrillicola CCALA 1050]|nr:hypothetical protein [Aetokthonos hydrillicola CCALA 1050]